MIQGYDLKNKATPSEYVSSSIEDFYWSNGNITPNAIAQSQFSFPLSSPSELPQLSQDNIPSETKYLGGSEQPEICNWPQNTTV